MCSLWIRRDSFYLRIDVSRSQSWAYDAPSASCRNYFGGRSLSPSGKAWFCSLTSTTKPEVRCPNWLSLFTHFDWTARSGLYYIYKMLPNCEIRSKIQLYGLIGMMPRSPREPDGPPRRPLKVGPEAWGVNIVLQSMRNNAAPDNLADTKHASQRVYQAP